MLDVIIVSSDIAPVNMLVPMLSDHSVIDVELDQRCSHLHHDITFRTRRLWRTFDYDTFERDLRCSVLVLSPLDDVSQLVADYYNTLKVLLDVYAPYRLVRQSTRPSQMWFDAECHAARHSSPSHECRCVVVRQPSHSPHGKASSCIIIVFSTDYWLQLDYWSNAPVERRNNPC